jgi:hypothetical protein
MNGRGVIGSEVAVVAVDKRLEKGDEVWWVQIESYGPMEQPRIHHGAILGGGDFIVLYKWDDYARAEKHDRKSFERKVSRTKVEAVEDARGRLNVKRNQAEATILQCIKLLGALDNA